MNRKLVITLIAFNLINIQNVCALETDLSGSPSQQITEPIKSEVSITHQSQVAIPIEESKDGRKISVASNQAIAEGVGYLDAGAYDKAVDCFGNIAARYPDDLVPYYYLGLSYYGKMDLERAEKIFKTVLNLDPKYSQVYYYLGLIEYKKGNKDKALQYLDKTTSLDNSFQSAYYNKGVTYLAMDMPEQAVREFAHALSIAPQDSAAFAGFLKAYARLDFKDIDMSNVREPSRMIYNRAQLPLDIQTGSKSMGNASENKNMSIFILSASGEEKLDSLTGEPITLLSVENIKGILEIDFNKPEMLRKKIIRLKARGGKGAEKIKVVLRDETTRRSPNFYLRGISTEWQTFYICPEDNASNISLDKIEHIRFELLPLGDTSVESMVFFKDIEII